MKQYITMKKTNSYDIYKSLEAGDYRFIVLWDILSDKFRPSELIDWLMDDNKKSKTNEYVSIRKEENMIELYDISDCFGEESTYASINAMLADTQKFEMSVKNFAEILYQWEQLRITRPEIILIVIHEDNHVSLETDPVIIKEYQDAGYAFDINKK